MNFQPARPYARPRGFTLIEILIVLVIACLLAAFGLPAFMKYSSRGKLATAERLLKEIASEESAWLSKHKTYATLSQLGYPLDSSLGAIYLGKDGSVAASADADSIYRISINLTAPAAGAADSSYFLITAQPVNRQVNDSDCATLSLASTGQPGATGTLGEAGCWEKSG
jgi:type IV pilus assembly protein PilE